MVADDKHLAHKLSTTDLTLHFGSNMQNNVSFNILTFTHGDRPRPCCIGLAYSKWISNKCVAIITTVVCLDTQFSIVNTDLTMIWAT